MTTLYARNITNDWTTNTAWSLTGSGGASAGVIPTINDDVIFDAGALAVISVNTSTSCKAKTLTTQGQNRINFSSSAMVLDVRGNVTIQVAQPFTGAGTLKITGGSFNCSFQAILPFSLNLVGACTLLSDLQSTGTFTPANASSITGAVSIDFDTFEFTGTSSGCTISLNGINCNKFKMRPASPASNTFVAISQTTEVIINTEMDVYGSSGGSCELKSSTPNTPVNVTFYGTRDKARSYFMRFTDINFSFWGQDWDLDNWCGDTLTRTSGIRNINSITVGQTETDLILAQEALVELQSLYDQLLIDYNALQDAFDVLEGQYNQLLIDYNALEVSFNNLQALYDQLVIDKNALQALYDQLQIDFNNLQLLYDELLEHVRPRVHPRNSPKVRER